MKKNRFPIALWMIVVFSFFLMINNLVQAKTITIGGTMPLNIGLGTEAKKCWELIVDHVNNTGGLTVKGEQYNLKLIIYDDKYTAEGGKSGVERLIYKDKCKYIIGMIGSAPTYASVAVTEPEGALMMSGCATAKILNPEYKYTIRNGNLPSVTVARWGYVVNKYPSIKTYAMFAPDDETGRYGVDMFKKILASYGKTSIDVAFYPRGTTDFSAMATRIKTANPDFVIFPASRGESDFGLQLKSLYEVGYRGLKVGEMFHADVIKTVATNEMVEGVVAPVMQSDLPEGKRNKSSYLIEELYKKKYGKFITTGVNWTKPLFGFMAAVKKANSLEIDDIMKAFARLEYEYTDGVARLVRRPDLKIDRYCDTVLSMEFGVVKNGRVIHDKSVSVSDVLKACEKVFGGSWE